MGGFQMIHNEILTSLLSMNKPKRAMYDEKNEKDDLGITKSSACKCCVNFVIGLCDMKSTIGAILAIQVPSSPFLTSHHPLSTLAL